jgi:hypothetical protein
MLIVLFDIGTGAINKRKIATAKAKLHSDIQSSVPVGSSVEEVMSFLDKNRILHSQLMSAGKDEVARVVIGAPSIIEARTEIFTFSPYSYSLHIVFKFDERHRLISHEERVEGKFL